MTEEKLNEFLDYLAAHGWKIEKKDTPLQLNETVRRRYPALPPDYEMFLSRVATARAPGDQSGFWGGDDYNDPYESDIFSPWWYEGFCLEIDPSDPREKLDRIRRFWDEHFPIALAVHSEYACLAVSVRPEDYGSVIYNIIEYYDNMHDGYVTLSGSFEELMDLMRYAIEKGNPGKKDDYYIWDFV